jgi:CubicO group peptidase (beta-lactamase class C family)
MEVVTGQTFEATLRTLVIEPLGLSMTFFRHWAHEFITYRVAAGHLVPEDTAGPVQVARPYALSRSGAPTGGIVSTVQDVLRYARFHLGEGRAADGTRLLAAERLREMQEPLVRIGYLGTIRGLTWSVYETQGVKRVGHQGATHGQQALLTLAPSRGFALVVLTNSNRGAALAGRVAAWALERYLGIRPEEPAAVDIPLERRREYAGTYRGHGAGLDVVVSVDKGGTLRLQATERGSYATANQPERPRPPARAFPIGEDALRVAEGWDQGNVAEFLRDRAGTIRWLRYAGRVLVRESA